VSDIGEPPGPEPDEATFAAEGNVIRVQRRRRNRFVLTGSAASALLLLAAIWVYQEHQNDDPQTSAVVGPPRNTGSPLSLPAPALTMTMAGEPVRGATVTLTVHGLDAVHTVSGGDRVGTGGGETGIVDRHGFAVIEFHVPNALSGADDIIPVVPGDPYLLTFSPRMPTGGQPGSLRFDVTAAAPNKPYPATAVRGAAECGAPPLEIDFDGREWLPDQPERFPMATKSFAGTFTILAERSGQFVATDGTTTNFTPADTGYAC
jgi:hypothetical protein